MNDEKLAKAFAACRAMVPEHIKSKRYGFRWEHIAWMCEEAPTFLDREKAMRWLGFVQGFLWTLDVATIDQLKDMNRSAPVAATETGNPKPSAGGGEAGGG